MNAYEAVKNFRDAFDGIEYEELVESLKFTFSIWDTCCARESFDNPKLSEEIKKFFMLHDMMAIHHGYWGYLEFENVTNLLESKAMPGRRTDIPAGERTIGPSPVTSEYGAKHRERVFSCPLYPARIAC